MRKLLFLWILIAVTMTAGLTFIGMTLKSQNKSYYILENKIKDASKLYLSQFPELHPSNKLVLTSKELKDVNYLDNINNGKETCTGYVIVKKNYMDYKFSPYIKCSSYKTKDYKNELNK